MQGLSLTWVRNHLSLRDPEKPDMLELKQPSEQQPWASFLTMRGFTCIYVDNVAHLSSWKWKSLSHVQLFATLWTIQSMEFSRPEYWRKWLFPSLGDLPNPGIKPRSPTLQADSLQAKPPGKPKNTAVGSLSLLQGTSQPRNLIGVSCIAGGFFTSWATREDHLLWILLIFL